MHNLVRRATLATVLVPILALIAPSLAQADTLTITHDSDPVENIPFRVDVGYTTANSNEYIYATIKSAGGAGCGPDYSADQGRTITPFGDSIQGSGTDVIQVSEPEGSYLVCAYEQQDSDQTTPDAPLASDTIAVRQIHASLSIAAPRGVRLNVPFRVTATYSVEDQRYLYLSYAKVTPGASCPQTYSLEPSDFSDQLYGDAIQGAGTDTANITLDAKGTYLFCGWVQQNSVDSDPAAVASATLTIPAHVSSPRHSCRGQWRTLSAAQRALRAARARERHHPSARNRRAVRHDARVLSRARGAYKRCQG